MRGGALIFIVWGTINLILVVINWIWDFHQLNPWVGAFMVTVIYLAAVWLLLARGRETIRKGAPEYAATPESLPRMSFGASGTAIAVGLAIFGLVFGKFLIFIGGGLLLLSLGRLRGELRSQRRTMRTVRRERVQR